MEQQHAGLEEVWPRVRQGAARVLAGEPVAWDQWMAVYTGMYQYCTTPRGQLLYGGAPKPEPGSVEVLGEALYERLAVLVRDHMRDLLATSTNLTDEDLVNFYDKHWVTVHAASRYLSHLFNYLNRHYVSEAVAKGKKVQVIEKMCLYTWVEEVVAGMRARLVAALLGLVLLKREGKPVDSTCVLKVFQSFGSLTEMDSSLLQNLTSDYLKNVEQYYTAASADFISSHSIPEYLRKIIEWITFETETSKSLLQNSTGKEVADILEQALVHKHVDAFLADIPRLIEQELFEDIGKVFNLFAKVQSAGQQLQESFGQHVFTVGTVTMKAASEKNGHDPQVFVEALLGVHKKYCAIAAQAFHNDPQFTHAFDKAFKRLVNENAFSAPAELLAKYTDVVLNKKGGKSVSDAEMEGILNDIIIIFKDLDDKDIFQSFYSKMLAKRLIYGASHSEEVECSLIGKFKNACGFEYAAKLQRMVTDISINKDLNEGFITYCERERKPSPANFHAFVLAMGAWPLNACTTNFNIPIELRLCEELFSGYYTLQHSGRKLTWLHQLGQGDVRVRFNDKPKGCCILQVSAHQLAILLTFEYRNTVTLGEIQDETQLPQDLLNATLDLLVRAKVFLTDGSPLTKTTKVKFNTGFQSAKGKLMLFGRTKAQPKPDAAEQKLILESRKWQIQAAIVRIMKTRKELAHTELMDAVSKQIVSFQPKPQLIKICINKLIEQEFLERVKDKQDVYAYVA
eukprot:TRINITY_DN3153_c0_g1_i2.p1 TRINITY_DN3153_c0_g1~~TRINITY_DN3153_c0_g1_i2.p1  ORF type:complete len:746 (+),score=189.96 TRINITY_DN3153_c0_g1_i2:24-2240(+)